MQGPRSNYIIGLGSPLLDLQAEVTQDFLNRYGLTLNNTYFAEEKHYPLYEEIVHMPEYGKVPGGASLNTLRMAQWMLQSSTNHVRFVGCVGDDHFAKMLKEVTLKDNVDPVFDVNREQPTGKCAVLLNAHDRCLVPLIGAAGWLSEDFVEANIDLFKNANILFSEVYFLYAKPELMFKIYELASQNGVKTCLTLASVNAVTDKLEEIKKIYKWVDFIFGNEEEVKQLGLNLGFNDENLGVTAQKLANLEKINNQHKRVVVVTRGKYSTIVAQDDLIQEIEVDLIEPSKIVDANAAGDSFSGGFISQLLRDADIKQCTLGGHYAAAQCIQHQGSSLPNYKPQFP